MRSLRSLPVLRGSSITVWMLVLGVSSLFLSPAALGQQRASDFLFGGPLGRGEAALSLPLQIVILLTLLTLLPAAVVSMTPFLRIVVVLHFLRQALGTQTVPSNQVLLGLALFLTVLLMQPTASQIYTVAYQPLQQGKLTVFEALDKAADPMRVYMLHFAREKDIRLFLEVSQTPPPETPQQLPMKVLIPAYILSELRAAFQIGAILYLPFLIIDLIVASVTLSVGMIQLPPVMLSAPFKILLFVLVDGWSLVVGSLIKSLYVGG